MQIDPTIVYTRLENVATELERLETKLDRETARGYHVSREWPAEVGAAAGALRSGAAALRSLGGTREALAGEALLAQASSIDAFAGELRTAYESRDAFGPAHADWSTRFDAPIRDLQAALDMLASAPARP